MNSQTEALLTSAYPNYPNMFAKKQRMAVKQLRVDLARQHQEILSKSIKEGHDLTDEACLSGYHPHPLYVVFQEIRA